MRLERMTVWEWKGKGSINREETHGVGRVYKRQDRTFLSGPVVKNLPANTGDTGLIPGPGRKIPRALEQLSPWATTIEPVLCNKRNHCSEKSTYCN